MGKTTKEIKQKTDNPKTSTTSQNTKLPSADSTAKKIAKEMCKQKWGLNHWSALHELVTRESTWRPDAINPKSGACGLFQALPCSKMGSARETVRGQIEWGLSYISQRYGNPTNALHFHDSHNWY